MKMAFFCGILLCGDGSKRLLKVAELKEGRGRIMMKKTAAFLLAVMMLTGCIGAKRYSFEPTKSSIYIARNGSVKSALVEPMEGDTYKSDDLKAFAQVEVDAFNASHKEDSVKIEKVSIKDGTGKIILAYDSVEDMIEFAAATQDDSIRVSSITVSKVDSAVTTLGTFPWPENVKKKGYIAAISGNGDFYTEGKIVYTVGDRVSSSENEVHAEGTNYLIFE